MHESDGGATGSVALPPNRPAATGSMRSRGWEPPTLRRLLAQQPHRASRATWISVVVHTIGVIVLGCNATVLWNPLSRGMSRHLESPTGSLVLRRELPGRDEPARAVEPRNTGAPPVELDGNLGRRPSGAATATRLTGMDDEALAAATRAGGVVEPARFLGCSDYLAWFRVAGYDAHFTAKCTVDVDGRMLPCVILQMSAPAMEAALRTLASCHWKPARLNGSAVPVLTTFKVQQARPS
jgi:hypothetical protein